MFSTEFLVMLLVILAYFTFLMVNFITGNVGAYGHRLCTRMIMLEKPSDGTVAMHYGEPEDGDVLSAEDYLPTLPNTVSLLCSLHLFDIMKI